MIEYYDQIFKRKSFHLFRGVGQEVISDDELDNIREAFDGFQSLYPEIRTAIRIIPSVKKDAQYCVLINCSKKSPSSVGGG